MQLAVGAKAVGANGGHAKVVSRSLMVHVQYKIF
jgi:hypothetical protein